MKEIDEQWLTPSVNYCSVAAAQDDDDDDDACEAASCNKKAATTSTTPKTLQVGKKKNGRNLPAAAGAARVRHAATALQEKYSKAWTAMYNKAVAYKQKHGHILVPKVGINSGVLTFCKKSSQFTY